MLKIGITGGIGSGKTTVCRLLERFGVPVYYADDRAKWLMSHQEKVKNALITAFGAETYTAEGRLNRPHLASIVFKDKKKLEELNAIVHPAVHQDGIEWQAEQEEAGVAYTVKEAALLFETGSYAELDKIVVVTAPEEVRINRVLQREDITVEQIKARIKQQLPQEEKIKRADFVINNGAWETLNISVSELHEKLLYLAKRP
ncbi:MAG: dephospho-CoA kinase [Aureispira sp.]